MPNYMDMDTGEVHRADAFGETWCSYNDPDVFPEDMTLEPTGEELTCTGCEREVERTEDEEDV